MMGRPKKVESMAMVRMVNLCCPLSHLMTEGIGKLLLGEASLPHERFYLGDYVLRDTGEHLLEFIVDGFHESMDTKCISIK